jgi:cytochrome P450
MSAPTFDPLADGFFDDPYPQYELLRATNPVHTNERGIVFAFGYDAVRTILIDGTHTSMERERAFPPAASSRSTAPPTFPTAILNRDPPDHTRLRRLLGRAFTPRRMNRLDTWMAGVAEEFLDGIDERWRDGEPVDFIESVAFPFPFRVISELLGMPATADEEVRVWAHRISRASDPLVTREEVTDAVAAYRALCDYIATDVLPWKRANQGDDLFSQLLVGCDDGTISDQELLDHVGLLYVAGHETTAGLIGNGALNLLRHRSQLERLQADPGLLANAVEELNRFDSSVQFAWRYVIEDLDVAGTTIPAGSMVFVNCGGANRDPEHFGPTAAELDIGRVDAKDATSFGAGIHYCVGATLARREATTVLGRFFERFPDVDLAGEPEWGRRMTFRSLEHLPLAAAVPH